jgi:hypothetical protein
LIVKEGVAALPPALPKSVPAEALLAVKVRAGVELPVETEVVKRGEKFPAVKFVTVPVPQVPEPTMPLEFVPRQGRLVRPGKVNVPPETMVSAAKLGVEENVGAAEEFVKFPKRE